jgi:diacylglycerol kinase (ATP)
VSPSNAPPALRRVLLIVNPGARRAARISKHVVEEFQLAGVHCDTAFTTAPAHATELARQRGPEYDAVFTLGGDGTAMEVITALAGSGPPVGILPGGTGNILVRSLRIPLRVNDAVKTLLHGRETRLDLGRLGDGRHFAIGLGIGIDEAMIAGASRAMKKRTGVLAYVWSALHAGWRLEQFHVKLTVDGKVHEMRASSVIVANLGSVVGGLITFGPGIGHDDGLLNACVYSPRSVFGAVRIFSGMLRGNVEADPHAFIVAGRHFRIETDPPRRAQADGELLGMTPIEVTVEPAAARLLVPQRHA